MVYCLLAGKFNLGKLYEKIGFNKEIISRGRYAELTAAEQRPFRQVSDLFLGKIYTYKAVFSELSKIHSEARLLEFDVLSFSNIE